MELYAQVLVNRMFHCKFLHRAPFTESDAVQVLGAVRVSQIKIKGSKVKNFL